MRYIAGGDNVVADTFSRISQINLLNLNDLSGLAEDQFSDHELQSLMGSGTGLELRPMYFASSIKPLYCDASTGTVRPLVSTTHHGSNSVFVRDDLVKASHVFLRTVRVRKSLEPPYACPCKVLSRAAKVFTVEIDGKPTTVSKDRLKTAHLFPDEVASKIFPPAPAYKAQKLEVFTRYGRRVLFRMRSLSRYFLQFLHIKPRSWKSSLDMEDGYFSVSRAQAKNCQIM
ncbi:hypothetical protein AVEN_146257-1 [Araneus ventricosus]|uniref:Uncharacterized protein n=1 Tax=Araneus ventricosus TaxID=182803 RepID=A0A4Y2GFQ3_ARAVE|nr:hypothetical protein AVEN_146257-1 [Araneus ventricosus]